MVVKLSTIRYTQSSRIELLSDKWGSNKKHEGQKSDRITLERQSSERRTAWNKWRGMVRKKASGPDTEAPEREKLMLGSCKQQMRHNLGRANTWVKYEELTKWTRQQSSHERLCWRIWAVWRLRTIDPRQCIERSSRKHLYKLSETTTNQ